MVQSLELVFLAIVLLALGVALFFAELETDEAELFGPAAIFFLIVGSAMWFLSGPSGTLISPELFILISLFLVSVVLVLVSFSVFVTYKMVRYKHELPEPRTVVGETGKALSEIGMDKEGYILFQGERWRALSNQPPILKDQMVRVVRKEGLTLYVEPEDQA
jgi:membrane-bound ClpP family serine protease